MIKYKGYQGRVDYVNEETGVLTGRVVGIGDMISFEGRSAAELAVSFRAAVDGYLA